MRRSAVGNQPERKVIRPMSEKTLRIGLIGAGGNTKAFHIPGLKKRDGVEIVAVANRTRESSQRVADEFAIPKVHDHWQALLEDASIDAVCIGTWPYMHAPLTIAALAAHSDRYPPQIGCAANRSPSLLSL